MDSPPKNSVHPWHHASQSLNIIMLTWLMNRINPFAFIPQERTDRLKRRIILALFMIFVVKISSYIISTPKELKGCNSFNCNIGYFSITLFHYILYPPFLFGFISLIYYNDPVYLIYWPRLRRFIHICALAIMFSMLFILSWVAGTNVYICAVATFIFIEYIYTLYGDEVERWMELHIVFDLASQVNARQAYVEEAPLNTNSIEDVTVRNTLQFVEDIENEEVKNNLIMLMECKICFDGFNVFRCEKCFNGFCLRCYEKVTMGRPLCPYCRHQNNKFEHIILPRF